MWQKKGHFIKEHPYTEDCNHLCTYNNFGPGAIQEIKLVGYVNNQCGVLVKFSNFAQAIEYKDFLGPINQHQREAVQQQENITMIKTIIPVYLASFVLGLNRITNYPEATEVESSILSDLNIDLTENFCFKDKDEPEQNATLNALVNGILRSLAAKDGLIFEEKRGDLDIEKYPRFFPAVKENKDIDDIATLSPR